MLINVPQALSFHQLGARSNQEDARYPDSDHPSPGSRTFVVCDGVGGAQKGEVASSTVAASIGAAMQNFAHSDQEFTDVDFAAVLDHACNALALCNRGANTGMATTLTFAHIHRGGIYTAHIGDSRVYHLRPGAGVLYRSDDHSLVGAMVRGGQLTPEQAIDHPKSNIITRCLGGRDTNNRPAAACYNLTDIRPGDYILLCTDGVLHCIDDDGLAELMSTVRSDEDKMATLAALCAASTDNNTAMLIPVENVVPDYDDAVIQDLAEEDPADNDPSAAVPTQPLKALPPTGHDVKPRPYGQSDPSQAYDDDGEDYRDEDYDDDGEDEGPGARLSDFFRRLFD